MSSKEEEEEAKKFVHDIMAKFKEEPNFFDVKTGTVSEDWCIWYAATTKGNPNNTFGMVLVKMLVTQAQLAAMIEAYWETESEVALKILRNNPQIWPLLMTLEVVKKKPKRFQWLRNLFKRMQS